MECINIGEPAGPTSSLSPLLGSRLETLDNRQTRPDTSRGTGYSYKPLLHCNNRCWILDPNALISKRRRWKEGRKQGRRAAHALTTRGFQGPSFRYTPFFKRLSLSVIIVSGSYLLELLRPIRIRTNNPRRIPLPWLKLANRIKFRQRDKVFYDGRIRVSINFCERWIKRKKRKKGGIR